AAPNAPEPGPAPGSGEGRLDTLFARVRLVDGTGSPARDADVGVRDGRIARIAAPGGLAADAARVVDGDGLVLAPGFVDPHTHYDAQLLWDPLATPSSLHGVTTVVGGNCGFTIAPLAGDDDADYLRRMLAKVEGMPLAALEQGLAWDWRGFGDYLARFEGRIAVNAAFLVGHCALRRAVMRERAVGNAATPSEIDAMVALLHASIEAGGLGFSTSLSFTHTDGEGRPVPSRWAERDEVLALCRALRDHEGTTLEWIVDGCLKGFTDEEIELATEMALAAGRPANWNVLTVDAQSAERVARQVELSERAAERGARIVALTMPTIAGMCASFGTHSALHSIPGWAPVMQLPVPERIAKLRDADVRRELDARARSKEAGVFAGLARWGDYRIGTTFAEANAGLEGRRIADVARERGASAFDALLDVVVADGLRTVLWPSQPGEDDASWALRARTWEHPYVMLGGSDAGAHLDRMCGSSYPTAFLRDVLRGRRLVPLERAVAMMSGEPAELFGLRDRGLVREGFVADLVLFDPERVDAAEPAFHDDLPGASRRLTADAIGVRGVWVGGVRTLEDGSPTGALPGRVLRPGADTRTASL
ncbi:MAG: amidohydrolase family protein, partial [Myxococcales bacterium]|nr:amidohydrolase family protein [Myxococcales bacterium]